ncbi:MAG: hypothetical protein ACOY7J_10090, partial [Pseudomonadota bacterium]
GLADSHPDLSASLVLAAWGSAQQPAPCRPDAADRLDLQHFIAGHKTYENAAAALWRHVLFWLHARDLQALLKPEEQTLLVGKILQKQPWDELAHRIGCSGVRDARERLRKVLQCLQAELGEPR